MMRSVTVRLRYKYDHREDAVVVTLDFATEMAAQAFAARFDGVYQSSTRPASPDSSRHLSKRAPALIDVDPMIGPDDLASYGSFTPLRYPM